MKPHFVADLNPDTSVTSFFLVSDKQLRPTRNGKPFLRIELTDRTGRIEACVWEDAETVSAVFDRDDIVKVQARVESYRNKIQLSVDKLRRAEPGEIDLADFFPHTAEDVEKLYAALLEHAGAIGNPWLRTLVAGLVTDPAIVPRLKRAPAAKLMHHAFLGGLLEHVVSLCGLARLVAGHYRELDLDLLLTGAILHDIGKLDELSYERSTRYTDEGELLGHIILELEQVGRAMDAIAGFPQDLKTLVKHLLISHHGQYEFGSPKLPMFPEALVLHYLDDLDSKLGAARAALAAEGPDANWSGYSSALNRRMLRVDAFRAQAAASKSAGSEPAAAAKGVAAPSNVGGAGSEPPAAPAQPGNGTPANPPSAAAQFDFDKAAKKL